MREFLETIDILIEPHGLEGILRLPKQPIGLIIFAHGSGSSRFSSRNTFVARKLCDRGFATLLFDLLTADEEQDRRNVFDIPLLGSRLGDAVAWASTSSYVQRLPMGLFGASTGAAAALVAAANEPARIRAVVSRGGAPRSRRGGPFSRRGRDAADRRRAGLRGSRPQSPCARLAAMRKAP